jgi:hypothetical protein
MVLREGLGFFFKVELLFFGETRKEFVSWWVFAFIVREVIKIDDEVSFIDTAEEVFEFG